MHHVSTDTRLGVATTLGSAVAAMCVQLVDASGNLAIHMPTRILLRSSSTHEPSDPPLEVVRFFWQASAPPRKRAHTSTWNPPTPGRLRKHSKNEGFKESCFSGTPAREAAAPPSPPARAASP